MSSLRTGGDARSRALTPGRSELRRELVSSALLMLVLFLTTALVLGIAWLLGS